MRYPRSEVEQTLRDRSIEGVRRIRRAIYQAQNLERADSIMEQRHSELVERYNNQ